MVESISESDDEQTPRSRHAIARRITLSLAFFLTMLLVLAPMAERAVIGEDVWPPLHPPRPLLIHGTLINPWFIPVAAIVTWVAWIIARSGAKPQRQVPRPLRIFLSILTAAVLVIESATYALTAIGVDFHILTPTSVTGCTVIATYTTGMWASGGDFLIVPSGSIVPRPTDAGWDHLDGSYNDPFADPSWIVTWNGTAATIAASGDPRLVSVYGTPVRCE